MKKCKLLLLDLDGTLLQSDKTISTRTLSALKKCRENDILIGVSTSRSEQNSLVFLNELMPFVNKLKTLIKNLTIQCVRLKEEVIQLRKEKKRLSDDVEFYKGKIKDMSDRTELLQEKVDDLERVKRYAGAEQIDTIIRKVKEQERT